MVFREREGDNLIIPAHKLIEDHQKRLRMILGWNVCFHPAVLNTAEEVEELYPHNEQGKLDAQSHAAGIGGKLRTLKKGDVYTDAMSGMARTHGVDDQTHVILKI